MKNPIEFIKHLWKDPVNTIEEVEQRKKEIMPWLLGSIGVAVLFCGLDGILGTGILMILGMVGVAGVMMFGFLLFICMKAKEKFAALTCNACNTMAKFENEADYVNNVSYSVSEDVTSNVNIPKPSDSGIISEITARGSGTASVRIQLKCPNCGATKELSYIITPFKCSASEKKVAAGKAQEVAARLQASVNAVVAEYANKETRKNIPYTIQSIHHPNYEDRTKPTTTSTKYQGVTIDYHREVDELVEGFFLHNELNGKIVDHSKDKK